VSTQASRRKHEKSRQQPAFFMAAFSVEEDGDAHSGLQLRAAMCQSVVDREIEPLRVFGLGHAKLTEFGLHIRECMFLAKLLDKAGHSALCRRPIIDSSMKLFLCLIFLGRIELIKYGVT